MVDLEKFAIIVIDLYYPGERRGKRNIDKKRINTNWLYYEKVFYIFIGGYTGFGVLSVL